MTEKISKLLSVFEYFYQIIIVNLLFLITNSCLFQIIFFVDFQVVFFPLYFIVSLPLIPSLLALLRSIDEIKNGREVKLIAAYLRMLLFSIKKEYRVWGGLLIAIFITLTSLYVTQISGLPTFFLYTLNMSLLICEGLLFINLLFNGLQYKEMLLTQNLFTSFLPNSGRNALLLLLILLGLFIAFKISFSIIIFIFGFLLEMLYKIFTKSRRR